MLTVGSLFAGIGGFDLGLERAGMKVIWQAEIDERKRSILARHWPQAKQVADVRQIRRGEVEGVDVLAGGFPCKDISHVGRRAGLGGKHSGLWAEFARCIRELRPRYVIMENVPGLLVRGMGTVLGDLADCGYDAEWDCIPAAAVGAPHLRARMWILAYPGGQRKQADDAICAGRSELVVRHTWAPEPEHDRVDDGFPWWMVGAAGDAIVPQIAEIIGRAIIEAEKAA